MSHILLRYLRDRRRTLCCCLCLGAAARIIFWLYKLPPEPLFYCFLVLAALGLGFFGIPDFVGYRRRAVSYSSMRESAPELPEPIGPDEYPLAFIPTQERLLLETAESLRRRARELEQQSSLRQDELLEYYTLWGHQIKLPLAAMGVVLQSDPGNTDALRQELFKTERYVELVLGYLRIYSMSSDLRLERRPVRPIAVKAAKKFAPQFIYKHLSLELQDFDNQAVTDEKWLLFVLEQIISNAVKYTPSGKITISMGPDDVLTIADQGVGIDPGDLPRIFERGFTGMNGRVQSGSTGLGLYLARKVMDKLHNRIEVSSQPGHGTQVRLYLGRPEAVKD